MKRGEGEGVVGGEKGGGEEREKGRFWSSLGWRRGLVFGCLL